MKRLLLLLVLATLTLTAACGSDDDPAVSSGGDSGAAHNDADVEFAQNMIPHHTQAVEMAKMALEKSPDPDVKDLAGRIVKAQGPEIEKLTGWLEDWDEPVEGGAKSGMGGMGGNEMMSDEDMAGLEKATAADFDKMFLEMMIKHHKSAIKMAGVELEDGKFADAKALAQEIIDAQEAEITEMEEMLEGSSGSMGSTTTAP